MQAGFARVLCNGFLTIDVKASPPRHGFKSRRLCYRLGLRCVDGVVKVLNTDSRVKPLNRKGLLLGQCQ